MISIFSAVTRVKRHFIRDAIAIVAWHSPTMNFTMLDLPATRSTRVFELSGLEDRGYGRLTIRADSCLFWTKGHAIRIVQIDPFNPDGFALGTDDRPRGRGFLSAARRCLTTKQKRTQSNQGSDIEDCSRHWSFLPDDSGHRRAVLHPGGSATRAHTNQNASNNDPGSMSPRPLGIHRAPFTILR